LAARLWLRPQCGHFLDAVYIGRTLGVLEYDVLDHHLKKKKLKPVGTASET